MAYIFEQDGDYVNFNGGANVFRISKDSNCVAWFWGQNGDFFFSVYDNYFQVKVENIGSVIIDGTPLTEAADFPTAIRAVFTGLGGGSSGSSYLVYNVGVNQSGTSVPVLTEFLSTLGKTVTPLRNNVGDYSLECLTGFPISSTTFAPFDQDGFMYIPISNGATITGYYQMYQTSNVYINIRTVDPSFSPIEMSAIMFNSKIFLPEIRVYP